MAQYFFDTSAIVKYYHAEIGTPAVVSIFGQPGRTIRISSLGYLEIQSALAMKVRSGVLSRDAAGMGRARFLVDVAASDIFVVADSILAAVASVEGIKVINPAP